MKKQLIILSLLVITALAISHAADMQVIYLSKFLGINQKLNPRLMNTSESPDMSNFTLDEVGSFKERDLFSQYNSLSGVLGANPLTGLFKFYTATESKYFIACTGTKVALGTAGAFSSDITMTTNTVTAGTFWDACAFNNEWYMVNPTIPLMRWTGTGILGPTPGAPTNNCKYLEVHKGRLWAAGAESTPYRIYYSTTNIGWDWTTTGGFIDLPDYTQSITGIMSWGGNLYVFTETNVYVLSGSTTATFILTKSNSDVGAIAPRTITGTDSGIFFLSRTGIFSFNGVNSTKTSDKVEPLINLINKNYIKNACAMWDGQGKYWLSYTDSTSNINNKILIYDTLLKEWYAYDNKNINYFCRAYGGTDKGELYGGSSSSDGIVWVLQAAGGNESITHEKQTTLLTGQTYNTVVFGEEDSPIVRLSGINWPDSTEQDFEPNDGISALLHFDSDASDTSGTGHTFTLQNGAAISNTIYRVGSGSVALDGANDIIDTLSDDYFYVPTDCTYEFWFRTDSLPPDNKDYVFFCDGRSVISDYAYFALRNVSGKNYLYYFYRNGGAVQECMNAEVTLETNKWYHIALVRQGSNYTSYLNGKAVGTGTNAGSPNNYPLNFTIGSDDIGTLPTLKGWIDEFRLTKGLARYTQDFTPQTRAMDGTLTSANLNINSASSASLGTISWIESSLTNVDMQVTTRTGATDDSVDFNGWQTWVSTSTVVDSVTDPTVWFTSGDISVVAPTSVQARDIVFYETDDSVSPNCVAITVNGAISYMSNVYETIPTVDLSGYRWLGLWLKAPETHNTVQFGIGNITSNTVAYTTFNTVEANSWEYHYFALDNLADADINDIRQISLTYLGDAIGTIYLGEIYAYTFFDDDDVISSSPNDYIQYKVIMGSNNEFRSPEMTSLTLEYSPSAGTPETSLSSYRKTGFLSFDTPMQNKVFLDLYLEAECTTPSTVYIDYDVDDGIKTGTLSYDLDVSGSTVRKEGHFSANTYGKTIQFNTRNADKNSQIVVRGLEVRFRPEGISSTR